VNQCDTRPIEQYNFPAVLLLLDSPFNEVGLFIPSCGMIPLSAAHREPIFCIDQHTINKQVNHHTLFSFLQTTNSCFVRIVTMLFYIKYSCEKLQSIFLFHQCFFQVDYVHC
jgi:hypothetical protein